MEFMDLIRQRYSVRKYLSSPVSRDKIESCIEAARAAPSACNSQPWSFIAVDDPVIKEQIVREACSGIYSMNAFAASAPVMIVMLTETSRMPAVLGGLFRGVPYRLIDIGIACEHLCLRAAEQGLGTCMLGWFSERAVKKILKLPGKSKVDLLIPLGYPVSTDVPEKKRKPLKDILSFNMESKT